jgi:hypothetical protein
MYQIVVLGLAFSLLFGGAYYIKTADSEGVLSSAFTSRASATVLSPDMIIGTYTCDTTEGCSTVHTLTLDDQGVSTMTTIQNDQTVTAEGSWQLEKGQLVTVSLTHAGDTVYDQPHTFLIQSVGTSTLSKISYDTKVFTDIYKPVFVR